MTSNGNLKTITNSIVTVFQLIFKEKQNENLVAVFIKFEIL